MAVVTVMTVVTLIKEEHRHNFLHWCANSILYVPQIWLTSLSSKQRCRRILILTDTCESSLSRSCIAFMYDSRSWAQGRGLYCLLSFAMRRSLSVTAVAPLRNILTAFQIRLRWWSYRRFCLRAKDSDDYDNELRPSATRAVPRISLINRSLRWVGIRYNIRQRRREDSRDPGPGP